jgi:hypothetical protein
MLPGECVGMDGTRCSGCGAKLILKVCQSAAGYYLGHQCNFCGPYSRETHYIQSHEEAKKELEKVLDGGFTKYERF